MQLLVGEYLPKHLREYRGSQWIKRKVYMHTTTIIERFKGWGDGSMTKSVCCRNLKTRVQISSIQAAKAGHGCEDLQSVLGAKQADTVSLANQST